MLTITVCQAEINFLCDKVGNESSKDNLRSSDDRLLDIPQSPKVLSFQISDILSSTFP